MKNIEQKYKIIDEIEYVKLRPGMYVGSTVSTEQESWVYENGKYHSKTLNYNPGMLKIFCEILDNSIDEHKRNPTKLNQIKIAVDRKTGLIDIWDNGGIPVIKHSETNQYIPEMIFTNLRSGSNFDDDVDQELIGTNGVGSTITAILSTFFSVNTADGKNEFSMKIENGFQTISKPVVKKTKKNFTNIRFIPDFEYFGVPGIDDGNYAKIVKRIYDCAGCNPKITFWLNDEKIICNSFKTYIGWYNDTFVYDETGDWTIGLANSSNSFEQISFVNSVETYDGGTHIDYVMNPIIVKIREFFNKKYKFDLKPAEIKHQLRVFISANINRPKFNSQTKSFMISEPKDYKTEWKPSDAFIKTLLKSDVMKNLIEWAERKKELEELEALRKKNKKLDKKSNVKAIPKYEPALSKIRQQCKLILTEGDAAALPIISARNPNIHGVFPLKGKPINVRGMKIKDMIKNVELERIMEIVGLQFGKKIPIHELRYGNIVVASDSDLDGHHVFSLVLNMFQILWPDLVKQGYIQKLITPIVRVHQGKKEHEFMNLNDFYIWEKSQKSKNYTTTYLKGLGGNDTKYLEKYLSDESCMVPISYIDEEDSKALEIAFEKTNADARKDFIYGIEE